MNIEIVMLPFLILFLAATALAGFPSGSEPVPAEAGSGLLSEDPEEWKLAVQAWTFNRFSFYETVDKTASLGLKWLEAFPGQRLEPGESKIAFHHAMPAEARETAKEKLMSADVKVINYGVVGLPNNEAECRKVFDFAKEMGIETIVSEPPFDAFDLIDRLCQEYEIKVAVHNHPKPSRYWNPDTVLENVKGRSQWIGACADTGHWARSGVVPVEALKKLEGRIVSFHLKDLNEFGKRNAHDVPWGTGECNMDAILGEVRRQGFQGVFSVEYEHNWDKSMLEVRKCARYFEKAVASLFKRAEKGAAPLVFAPPSTDLVAEPYHLDTGLVSRSISFENPTGAPGEGGKEASALGQGRKGKPCVTLQLDQTETLCDIKETGTIRHIWITTDNAPATMRSLVIRAWWDNQEHPSIEAPLGDFMGMAHGKVEAYHSAAHSVGQKAGMNIWLPMPFQKRARFTVSNEGQKAVPFFYQIDYTIGDRHGPGVGRLHVLFRRENPTTLKRDFELLPRREGKGRFVGTVIGVRNLHGDQWWGEGEVKVYMDGDKHFPTICGTGSEDYVGLSWGIQQTPFPFNGCSLNRNNFISIYRWHLPDPIFWQEECRITIQQIAWKGGLQETSDDWSCATFWYEPVPSARLPLFPDVKARTGDIWSE